MNRSRWIAAVVVAVLVVLASYLLGGGEPAPAPRPTAGAISDGLWVMAAPDGRRALGAVR